MIGIVLAGGRSRRMEGKDKTRLQLNGRRVVATHLKLLKDICGSSALVVRKDQAAQFWDLGFRVYFDLVQDCGPLGGLYSVLKRTRQDIFLVACDLPFLNEQLLRGVYGAYVEGAQSRSPVLPRRSLRSAEGGGADCEANVSVEPLCAIWPKWCLKPAAQKIASGELSIRAFGEAIGAVYWDIKALDHGLLENINSPQDLTVQGNTLIV